MSAVWAKHGGAWEKVYPVTVLDAPVLTAMTTETSITYMWTAVDGATDYKFEFEDESNKIQCLCGSANCKKWMN